MIKSKAKPTFSELMKQALSNVEDGYNLLAPKFDATRYITPESILKPFFKKIKQERPEIKNGIDICCGTGAASLHLASLCKESFTAFDLSEGMLEQCRKKVEATDSVADLNFKIGNAIEMPFHSQFDLAVSFGAFGHILKEDEHPFISSIYNALVPGGDFYFITTGKLPIWSLSLWRQRIFNGVLRVRNFLLRPKFIMYYLTFRLPGVIGQLEQLGFEVTILDTCFQSETGKISDLMPIKYYRMVRARKK